MLKLYHSAQSRSIRPRWLLEELGVPYEVERLSLSAGDHKKPEYLKLNPNGQVPTLVDGDLALWESAAICQYLAARHSPHALDVGVDEADFGAYLNALHFGEATLTFPQTLILRYGRFEPPERRLAQAAEDYTRWFLSRLRTLEPRLATREFLCAGRFTAADVSVGYALMLATDIGLQDRF